MMMPAILNKAGAFIRSATGNGLLLAKKHAPEIMIGTGLVGFGATIYETVKATNKTNDILDRKETAQTAMALNLGDDEVDYDEVDYAKDEKELRAQTRWGIVRAWAPVATLGGASVISILGGYKVLNGRYVATAAAYKVLENGFERYRGNVVERFGRDTDWELLHDIKAEELQKAREEQAENKEIEADNKRKKIVKKRKKTAYADIYNGIFDEYSDRWQRYWNPEQVLHYLQTKENELNDKLRIRKHLFVNEVYDALGLERTPQGQVTGWIITRDNPKSEVSLGLKEMPEEELRQILNTRRNEDIRVKIRLQPDGLIYNMIDQKDYLCDMV